MLTHVLMGESHIDYSLAYVASGGHTSKGTKTAVQDARLALETITIEENAKCRKFISMILTKSNVASS